MQRWRLFFCFLLTFSAGAHQIRRVNWGMSPAEVSASEIPQQPVTDQGEILSYRDTLLGIEVTVDYMFFRDQLIAVQYRIPVPERDQESYERELNGFLQKKYRAVSSVFGIRTWSNGDMEINLIINRRSRSGEIRLVYSMAPMAFLEAPVIASLKEEMNAMKEAQKVFDSNSKL